jgi:hypothetical protein
MRLRRAVGGERAKSVPGSPALWDARGETGSCRGEGRGGPTKDACARTRAPGAGPTPRELGRRHDVRRQPWLSCSRRCKRRRRECCQLPDVADLPIRWPASTRRDRPDRWPTRHRVLPQTGAFIGADDDPAPGIDHIPARRRHQRPAGLPLRHIARDTIRIARRGPTNAPARVTVFDARLCSAQRRPPDQRRSSSSAPRDDERRAHRAGPD